MITSNLFITSSYYYLLWVVEGVLPAPAELR